MPADWTALPLPKPIVNVLVSYTFFAKTDAYRRVLERQDPAGFRLMVDSGAFTAWSVGKSVDLDAYVAYLRGLPSDWDVEAIQLDVIGDHKATLKNFLRMCDMGVETIPVFTRGAPLKDRETMYAHRDYVALGGLVGNADYLPFARHWMRTNKGRRVHLLGYTKVNDLKRYRPTSVDSSSIAGAQRYGAINYYAGAGTLTGIRRGAFCFPRTPQTQAAVDAFIASCRRLRFTGAEIRRLGLEESWNGDVARSVDAPRRAGTTGTGLASFMGFAHGVAHSIDVERNIGCRIYHAMAAVEHLDAVFKARDLLVERGVYGHRHEEVYA